MSIYVPYLYQVIILKDELQNLPNPIADEDDKTYAPKERDVEHPIEMDEIYQFPMAYVGAGIRVQQTLIINAIEQKQEEDHNEPNGEHRADALEKHHLKALALVIVVYLGICRQS